MERKALSKRLRFEIFKRDGFCCVYCGATPNVRMLHVDHVIPVAKGGTDGPENLVTACAECNGGKAAVPLSDVKLSVTPDKVEEAQERSAQLLAYLARERALLAARKKIVDALERHWKKTLKNWSFSALERSIVSNHATEFPVENLVEAMAIACSKFPSASSFARFKYYCGIVRQWRQRGAVTL